MTPLNIIQRSSIIKRIDFVETELNDLAEYHALDFKTYSQNRKIRREVDRIIENIANALIDIGKIVLAGESSMLPESYAEVFTSLEACGVINADLCGRIKDIARLRNILAHQYLDLKGDMLKNPLSQGRLDAAEFIREIQRSHLMSHYE